MVPTEFKTDDVRKAFSKASVVFAQNGISVSYTHKDSWVTQTLDVKPVFEWLLCACNGFSITIKPNEFIRFFFRVDLPLESMVFYPPIESEIEISLDDLISSITPDGKERISEFFYGVDFLDEDAVFEKLREFVPEDDNGNLIPLHESVRFERIKRLARVVLDHGFYCDLEFDGVGSDGVGFASFTIDGESHIPSSISGDLKLALVNLIRESGYFGFECSVCDGVIVLSFSN